MPSDYSFLQLVSADVIGIELSIRMKLRTCTIDIHMWMAQYLLGQNPLFYWHIGYIGRLGCSAATNILILNVFRCLY